VPEESLESKIKKWLSKTGYSLEMRVAKHFSSKGFRVTQSDYYIDFESGQKREIDIIARTYDWYEPPIELSISEVEIFANIECKAHQNQPWVFFKGDQNSIHDFETPLSNSDAQTLLNKTRTSLGNTHFYQMAKSATNGVTQALCNTKQDIPYKAIMSALKSAEGKTIAELEFEKDKEAAGGIDEYRYSACIFPIVITDAKLFEVSLTEAGEISVKEVGYSAVATRYPRRKERFSKGTIVYVFTESAIPELTKALDEFRAKLKIGLPEVLMHKNQRSSENKEK